MSDSSIPNPQLYELVRTLAAWYFTTFYDYTQSGLRNVPKCGPVIFAANHVSFYDPPAIGACIHRPINYFARDTLFKGLFGKALREIGTIPVARENADIKSLKAIFRVLKCKGIVAIYPEGTRSLDGQLMEPKPGAGMIACKSKATVIPTPPLWHPRSLRSYGQSPKNQRAHPHCLRRSDGRHRDRPRQNTPRKILRSLTQNHGAHRRTSPTQ